MSLIGQSSTKVDSTCTGSSSSDSFRVLEWVEQNWRRASSASWSVCSARCHPSFSSSGLSVVDVREGWGGGLGADLFPGEEERGLGCLSGLWVMTDVAAFCFLDGVGFAG